MKIFRKITAAALSAVIALSCASFFASAATPKITDLEIVTMPTKINYYKVNDWKYGYWSFPGLSDDGIFVAKDKTISFMHTGGLTTYYADRGIIDLNGAVVKVTYSDGTTKNIAYKETHSGKSVLTNYRASPEYEYFIGSNMIYIYFPENPDACDIYYINILGYQLGDVNNSGKVDSGDALAVLQHSVGTKGLSKNEMLYADMNSDSKYNSADALAILRAAVS